MKLYEIEVFLNLHHLETTLFKDFKQQQVALDSCRFRNFIYLSGAKSKKAKPRHGVTNIIKKMTAYPLLLGKIQIDKYDVLIVG